METTAKRKGARRIADIPPDIQRAINQGEIATANLMEFLSADLSQLVPAVARHVGLDAQHPALISAVQQLSTVKPMQRHTLIAKALWQAGANQMPIAQRLGTHTSDLARQWAAMQIALDDTLNLAQRLESARPFAADSHFGVREFAWMSVRPAVAQEVDAALSLLQPWVTESDANLRRFASELTRPRGVWCVHLEILKSNPERGIALLTPLMADASRYVQDSVANWLNDAAKSCPDWTRKTCKDWLANNAGKATQRICQRGQRSLKPA